MKRVTGERRDEESNCLVDILNENRYYSHNFLIR